MVSNRLPVRLVVEDGQPIAKPATGGLVTALDPVLRQVAGLWIGWDGGEDPGTSRAALHRSAREFPYALKPVTLDPELIDLYYLGFSNETLWPLFHDLLDRTRFRTETWEAYQRANRFFADAVIEATGPGDAVWVHDYHLALVAREVRKRGDRQLMWFLHIPFPQLDMLARLPWRWELMEALLDYDLLGFQTRRDLLNFLACVRTIVPSAQITGAGGAAVRTIRHKGRELKVGWFPISIDFRGFDADARTPEIANVASRIHTNLPTGTHVLGIDRLDYTKGIPERLAAFERFLEKHPEHRGKVTLVQVAVPSRGEVIEYQQLRAELEREVGRINGRYTRMGWAPILYTHHSLPRPELLGYYRACEVALITPLKDGMNLVAKEYCASSVDNDGVLILSEFAGAAAQLFGPALIVNPHDTEQVADTLHRAVSMDPGERAARMQRLRRQVRQHDIRRWVLEFSAAAGLVAEDSHSRQEGAPAE
ncbi:MAG: alpha,alpha-trehalose-phosphate synthase (UDP-forming) [Planctomycetota bacterium]